MGSTSISWWRKEYPGLSDRQLAERIHSRNPDGSAVIVRYKSYTDGEYDQFGTTNGPDQLLSYFLSTSCHDTEIVYVDPRVPPDMIGEVKRRVVEERRRSLGQCVMCGQRLSFFHKLLKKDRHLTCHTFKE